MIQTATHQPILLYAIEHTDKPIIEFGAGDYSTRFIHNVAKGRKIVTIEDKQEWITPYGDIAKDGHEFNLLSASQFDRFCKENKTELGVVFIDSYTWAMRLTALKYLSDNTDYIVLHDAERAQYEGHVQDFGSYLKYWIEFMHIEINYPSTLLGSNKIDLREVEIKDAIILKQNK